MKKRIYIVDDEPKIGQLFVNVLQRDGFEAKAFAGPGDMLAVVDDGSIPDVIIADLMMPDMNGIELLEELKSRGLSLPVLIMTAHSSVQTAVEAMRLGAFHYLQKPVNLEEMRALLKKALALYDTKPEGEASEAQAPAQQSRNHTKTKRSGAAASHTLDSILGESSAIQSVRETIQTLQDVPNTIVLISGETGTGKNLVARTLHDTSAYNAGRFMDINCAALPDNLLEAELFGYEKGAFTDARDSKPGLLEVADGGTVFLDEVDSMSMALQAKLLSFLESRTFRRLGGVDDIRVTTRILCATNANLVQRVADKEFRRDLYYRINVVNLHLPPLRRMGDDVLTIARHVLSSFSDELGRDLQGFTSTAEERLQAHSWTGNVRELRNVLERAAIFSSGPHVDADDLSLGGPDEALLASGSAGAFHFPEGRTLEDLECAYIKHALETMDATYAEVSEVLGISKKTLWEKRKRYNLDEQVAA
jgi:two-component system, NtrC family, response regulator AtoC